jgi:hypothetical protein
MRHSLQLKFNPRQISIITWLIIIAGILLRVKVYLDNRSLFLDEANVALNIFDRSYARLLEPLDNNQFAPPGFLWLLKFCTSLMGYSEYVYRAVPLLSGIVSCILFYRLLKYFTGNYVLFYALCLFAAGNIFLLYTTAVKQYSTDIVIALLLILLSFKVEIIKMPSLRFVMVWSSAALLSMWFSMPSIFLLTGIGAYYLYYVVREKSKTKFLVLALVILLWAAIFTCYYFFILSKGINSEYLQWFHKQYFIELSPANAEGWMKNGRLLTNILASCSGDTALAIGFNLLLLIVGFVYLLRAHTAKGILFLVPVVCLYIASGLHQFTLLPRVVLFIMPLCLVVITAGLNVVLNIKLKAIRIVVLATITVCLFNFMQLHYFRDHIYVEEYKDALNVVKHEGISGKHFHVNDLIQSVHIYYTHIHPDKGQWADLKNADMLPMYANYDSAARTFTKDAVLSAWLPDGELADQQNAFHKYCSISFPYVDGMNLLICTKK